MADYKKQLISDVTEALVTKLDQDDVELVSECLKGAPFSKKSSSTKTQRFQRLEALTVEIPMFQR